jgi:hypothetical protein
MQPVPVLAPSSGIPAGASRRGEAYDMDEEAWRGLEEGLRQFFAEEREEDEHAEDEAEFSFDAEFNESDHPRDTDGKFGSGGGGEPSGEKKGYKITGRGNLAKQGLKPRKRAAGTNMTGAIQVAWAWALQTNKTTTLVLTAGPAGGWTILKPGDRVALGQPHIDVDKDGNVTRYEYDTEAGDAATDSALAYDYMPWDLATDFAADQPVGGREEDQDGRLRVARVHISKANVGPYKGSEIPGWDPETRTHKLGLDPDKLYRLYRDPEELRKGAASSNGVQLLRKHIPVSADDAKQYDVVGSVGTEAAFGPPYLDNSLTVWTKEAIDAINNSEKKQLSMGYHYDPDMTPGRTADGEDFDGVMRNIRVNHVALVEQGRAGPDVVVADSLADLQWDAIAEALNAVA